MIGNELAAKAFDREFPDKVFRYVNGMDPVPKLPTVSLIANQYGHCLKEVGLDEAASAAGSTVDFFQSMGKKAVDGVLSTTLIDDIWKGLQERVGAHSMDNYKNLVAKLLR